MKVKNEPMVMDYVDEDGAVFQMTILRHFDFGDKRFVLAIEKPHSHQHHADGVCDCQNHQNPPTVSPDKPLYVFEWRSQKDDARLVAIDDETLLALTPMLEAM